MARELDLYVELDTELFFKNELLSQEDFEMMQDEIIRKTCFDCVYRDAIECGGCIPPGDFDRDKEVQLAIEIMKKYHNRCLQKNENIV